MTGSIKTVLLAASICCSVVGFVAWRVHATKIQAVQRYEIVEDPSRSHLNGCESLLGLAEQVLQHEPASSTSQLTILLTGDHATGNEPLRLAKYIIPRNRKAIEGRGAALRRQQELLADLHEKCRSLRRTDISPIFLAIKEALADLRAQGCNRSSGCKLYVDSDGEENVDKDIKEALNDGPRARRSLPARADNTGIQVIFCGLAATSGVQDSTHSRTTPRDSRREDRLRLTWRSVFVIPEIVDLEPYCPTSSISDTSAPKKGRTWKAGGPGRNRHIDKLAGFLSTMSFSKTLAVPARKEALNGNVEARRSPKNRGHDTKPTEKHAEVPDADVWQAATTAKAATTA